MLLTIDGEDKEAVGAKIQEYLKDLREERYVVASAQPKPSPGPEPKPSPSP